jgi:hypothetical protein
MVLPVLRHGYRQVALVSANQKNRFVFRLRVGVVLCFLIIATPKLLQDIHRKPPYVVLHDYATQRQIGRRCHKTKKRPGS